MRKIVSIPVKKRWILRKKTFSAYPYMITISYHGTNVFFTVADLQGRTKMWTSTGRSGYKNKDKTTYMAIFRVTEIFCKKLWRWGIRRALFKFKNLYKRRVRFGVRNSIRNSIRKIRPRILPKSVGLLAYLQVSFNGCQTKKKRRK